jgi:hypothetical protein
LSPAGSLTIPTTLKVVALPLLLPTAMVDPVVSLFCERDEDGLAHTAAKLTPQISEEHPAPL